jgi:hypothetical protein
MKSLTPRAASLDTSSLSKRTLRSHLRVFAVTQPVTIFIRGTRCQVNVRYHDLDQVELHAQLYNAFGLRFVTEQDNAGVYVVVKRRRLLGLISRAEFLLVVPRYANLTFNLTPGTIRLDEISGVVELPPLLERIPLSIPQIPPKH